MLLTLQIKVKMDEEEFCILCAKASLYMGRERTISYGHINCRERFRGYTLLHEAIQLNKPSFFGALLAVPYIDLNIDDRRGNTPLHLAIERKAIDFAMKLIRSARCDVNKKNNEGYTPLMYAVNSGEVLIAYEILKKCGTMITNEQNCFGNTALFFSCPTLNVAMLDLLIYYGADTRIKNNNGHTFFMVSLKYSSRENIVEFQRRAIDFQADMNEINAAGVSTLFLAIKYETPLLKEIVDRGANVNYFYKNQDALRIALRSSNRTAFDLIWPRFAYQHVYASYFSRPLLCEFFHDRRRRREDWLYFFHTIVNTPDIIEHAVQHYTFHNHLPPLVSEVVKSFVKRGFSEAELFPYVCVLVSYGAPVFLEDIETVYICYGDSNKTINFLLNMDVILEQLGSYCISHPYVMLNVNRDVDDMFNNPRFFHDFALWQQQLMFLPILFQVCTPPHRFIRKLYSLYNIILQKYVNQEGFNIGSLNAVSAAYKAQVDPLMTNMYFIPSLLELSRNATRKAICLQYNIEGYSEYRRLLRNFGLPQAIVNILLFRTQVTEIDIPLPNLDTRNMIRDDYLTNAIRIH